MLIKGKIIYNHDIKDTRNRNFIYDGHYFQVTDNRNQEEFDDKAIELEYNGKFKENHWVKEFLRKLEKANGHLSIRDVVFTQEELNVGLDYLKESYPVSIKWSCMSEKTIKDYFPYDYCGFGLLKVLDDIDTYLNYYPFNIPFYSDNVYIEYLTNMLADEISYMFDDPVVTNNDRENTLQDNLKYFIECYKNDPREPEYLMLNLDEWMIADSLEIEGEIYSEIESRIKRYLEDTTQEKIA